MTGHTSNFIDGRHVLYCGWVLGIAMKHDLPICPVIDENGHFTDRMTLAVGGNTITFVVPPPPPDWTLGGAQ